MDNVIVVGVDGSEGARRALHWALDEASRTGGVVHAVAAWTWDSVEAMAPVPASPEHAHELAKQICAAEVANAIDESGVRNVVSCEVIEGPAAQVLTEAAGVARLLVLGSHGHSQLYHSVLGSVSEACIHRATCPVVVVPVPAEERMPPAAQSRPANVSKAGRTGKTTADA